MKSEGNDGGTSYGSESKNARSIDRGQRAKRSAPVSPAAPPYLFFIPPSALPHRSLTRSALIPVWVSTGDIPMSDFIFIALGGGTLLVLALYARALDRL